jgi:hypothetical protein
LCLCYLFGVSKEVDFMKRNVILLISAGAMLFSCANPSRSDESSSSSESHADSSSGVDFSSIDNLRAAFQTLKGLRNYRMDVSFVGADSSYDFSRFCTEKYVYDTLPSAEWGYVLGEEGVYGISLYQNNLVSSELLTNSKGEKYQSVWDADLVKSFASLTDEFSDGEKEHVFTLKSNKLFLLGMADLSATSFLNLKKVEAQIGNGLETLSLKITMTNGSYYTFEFDDFSKCSNEFVDGFLAKGGKAFVPEENLEMVRKLFQTDNYNRDVLDLQTGASTGTEHFLPTYFCGEYSQTGSSGLMGINGKKMKVATADDSGHVSETEVTLYGSYYFTLSGNNVDVMVSQPYNASWDIPSKDVYNYPSNMLLWSSLQYLEESIVGEQYVTVSAKVIADFVANYQLTDILKNSKATATSLEVDIANLATNPLVTFVLSYSIGSASDTISFPMKDFGRANIDAIDTFMATKLY